MPADPPYVDKAINGFVRQCNRAAYEDDQASAPVDSEHENFAVFLPAIAPYATDGRVNSAFFREAFQGYNPKGSIFICPNAVKARHGMGGYARAAAGLAASIKKTTVAEDQKTRPTVDDKQSFNKQEKAAGTERQEKQKSSPSGLRSEIANFEKVGMGMEIEETTQSGMEIELKGEKSKVPTPGFDRGGTKVLNPSGSDLAA